MLAAVQVGCGKKGPPLSPLVTIPASVSDVSVQRLYDQAYIQFQIPLTNADERAPADLSHIEVYALTTDFPSSNEVKLTFDEWLDASSLVATVSVKPPGASGSAALNNRPFDVEHYTQGDRVTLVELLGSDLLIPLSIEKEKLHATDENFQNEAISNVPLILLPIERPPIRTYIILAVSTRGLKSEPSEKFNVSLGEPPQPPEPPTVTYTENEVLISWQASATAILPVQKHVEDWVLPSEPIFRTETEILVDWHESATGRLPDQKLIEDWVLPSEPIFAFDPPSRYEVYEVIKQVKHSPIDLPKSLNDKALMVTSYTDTRIEFGIERCYAVRVVDTINTLKIFSRPSMPTCISLIDIFSPSQPKGLVAVASEGSVNLSWTPNVELDLAGYIVLRSRDPDTTLEVITDITIKDTTFQDTTVEAGVYYRYAVQAIDHARPSNGSDLSEYVVEQAR